MGSIQLHIRFDEIDGFIKIYNGMRYLVIYMMKFVIGSNILSVELQIVLITILQKSELIHIILYQLKKY